MIPFIDLHAQQVAIKSKIDAAIARVMEHGKYIMGPEVVQLEQQLARYVDARHCIAVSNGTDALTLSLLALGVGQGDAIITTPYTFFATVESIMQVGAIPFFADIDPDTFNLSPDRVLAAIQQAEQAGNTLKGIVTVDLYGLPADYSAVSELANQRGLFVLQDGAQSFGAEFNHAKSPNHATMGTTSFFPAKPLGCYGDGGAVFTNDDSLADHVRSLRVHGKGTDKYDNVRLGFNARLDTIQAAILLEKLQVYPQEFEQRQQVAAQYRAKIDEINFQLPDDEKIGYQITGNARSAWAQFVIQTPKRDEIASALKNEGIPSVIYYRTPVHQLKACAHLDASPMPVAEKVSKEILALPFYPYLDANTIEKVTATIAEAMTIKQGI